MTNSTNPMGGPTTDGAGASAPPPSSTRFKSWRPLAIAGEPSLAVILLAIARCEHPEECSTPALIVEPDGTRMMIYWCGSCGALCIPSRHASNWIVPGSVMAMSAEPRLEELSKDALSLASRVSGARQMASFLRAAVSDASVESMGAEILARITRVDEACRDVEALAGRVVAQLTT